MAISRNLLQILIQTIKDSGNFSLLRYEELTYRDYPLKASSSFIKSMIEIHNDLLIKIDELEQTPCKTPQDLRKNGLKPDVSVNCLIGYIGYSKFWRWAAGNMYQLS